ncbi:patatin-like phospholipase family protein [Anabaena sp. UHCC 0253]|nr:patatin-like phospholipase family protein [Anabaena sp. UHCC 0204]MTJ54294.1 patatin-like phospholipase family protein [Anabaena sp. UHCC 0253]
MAELGLVPHIIAGTSIGALNGAVLSSYRPFPQAVQHLNQFWEELADAKILRPNTGTILRTLSYTAQTFIPTFQKWMLHFLIEQGLLKDTTAIFDPAPIEKLLREKIHSNNLRNGIELWVTVFPSLKIPGLGYDWLIDFVRSRTGTDAHWLCVQDFKDDETLYNLLLASAALPLAFPSREVNGKSYVDGGLADNVPLKALAARGCTHAIIIHLNNGVTWNRHDFPEQTIIEIRPEQPINKSDIPVIGLVDSWLDFSYERITELKQFGYEDAKRCLTPIIQIFSTIKEQRQIHNQLINSTEHLLNDFHL